MSAKRTGKGSSADQAARRLAKARKGHDRETQKKERERCATAIRDEVTEQLESNNDASFIEGLEYAIEIVEGLK